MGEGKRLFRNSSVSDTAWFRGDSARPTLLQSECLRTTIRDVRHMKLVVSLPRFSPAIDEVVVAAWVKEPSESVAYGDILCDVVVQQVTRMRRPLSALSKNRNTTEYAKIGVEVQYRITALDAGVLNSILVQPGDTVAVGEKMAILESSDGSGEAAARVVVNLIEDRGDDL